MSFEYSSWFCLIRYDFGLFLIKLSAHGQIVHAVIELRREQSIIILQGVLLVFGKVFLQLIVLIDQFLFALDVLEHVFGLGEDHIVREHLRVLIVEGAQLGQPLLCLSLGVRTLEEFVDVVQYQIVFED